MTRLLILPLFAVFALWYATSTPTPPAPAPTKSLALVFGAGLASSATPSLVLQDRLDTAYELYTNGTVDTLLLSGDSTLASHDEVGVMKAYLIKRGIPDDKISVDPQGVDTYATCVHAKNTFGAKEVVLVTQGFHMPRARYLCEGVGLTVQTAVADKRTYDPANEEREKKAMTKAWLQLNTGMTAEQLEGLEEAVK